MMNYIVNAWLERDEPQLKVTSNLTGQVLIDWRGEKVRQLIDNGELDVAELSSPTQELLETVKEILLISYEGRSLN